jgi:hypothetical protein
MATVNIEAAFIRFIKNKIPTMGKITPLSLSTKAATKRNSIHTNGPIPDIKLGRSPGSEIHSYQPLLSPKIRLQTDGKIQEKTAAHQQILNV